MFNLIIQEILIVKMSLLLKTCGDVEVFLVKDHHTLTNLNFIVWLSATR